MYAFTLALFVCLSLSLIASPSHAQTEDQQLTDLMEAYWQAQLAATPLRATALGLPGSEGELDEVGLQAREARRKRLNVYLDRLSAIKPTRLRGANREHYEAFAWMLENTRANLDHNTSLLTLNTLGGWHSSLPQLLVAQTYESEEDYRNYLSRLAEIPRYAQQQMEVLQAAIDSGYTQPCATLDGYVATISGYVSEDPGESVFTKPFGRMPDDLSSDKQSELRAEAMKVIADRVNPAYRGYAKFFVEDYLPACRQRAGLWSLPGGVAAYDQLLRFYTSLDTNAENVHALGLKEVARIQTEMRSVMDEVNFDGDFTAFLTFLRTDPQFYPTDVTAYLHYVAWVTRSIDAKLPHYFADLPRSPYGIKAVPAQTAPKTATAYYQPGAVDGSRAGQYFVNTYDLASRPLYEVPALSLHEAVPGHHLQMAIQRENDNLPGWRRAYYFQAFGEGWGLYAEYLGEEMGVYTTPYERFGRLIYEIWRAARLVVDTGLHAKGWTRDEAIEYMLANTGLTQQNVISEVNRYITYPGQATAYKHGELKILELRARAEARLGDRFDLKAFHRVVLEGGSMPLSVLEAKVGRWLDKGT